MSETTIESYSVTDLQSLIERGDKFGTIYADPPWQYGNQGTRSATRNHYGTMAVEDIMALPVAQLAAENAHLHLWITSSFLFEAPRIMEAWGFHYRSSFVWCKPYPGLGNYWRIAHEFLLLGVRGTAPFGSKCFRSWMEMERTKHSAKPELVRELIEGVSPGPYLEMFGRRNATGWTVFGNQIERTMHDHDVEELV